MLDLNLRERPEDIPLLARYALEKTRGRFGLPPLRLAREALDQLMSHPWPGNVRELENALDRAALLADDGVIRDLALRAPFRRAPDAAPVAQLASSPPQWSRRRYGIEAAEFVAAWNQAQGRVALVAKQLGVTRRTVYRLRDKYIEN